MTGIARGFGTIITLTAVPRVVNLRKGIKMRVPKLGRKDYCLGLFSNILHCKNHLQYQGVSDRIRSNGMTSIFVNP